MKSPCMWDIFLFWLCRCQVCWRELHLEAWQSRNSVYGEALAWVTCPSLYDCYSACHQHVPSSIFWDVCLAVCRRIQARIQTVSAIGSVPLLARGHRGHALGVQSSPVVPVWLICKALSCADSHALLAGSQFFITLVRWLWQPACLHQPQPTIGMLFFFHRMCCNRIYGKM